MLQSAWRSERVIGAAPASHVYREKPVKGDFIVLIGGRTGRDGCGGATGSSKGHTMESILTCGAEVQKGQSACGREIYRDCFEGKRLQS